MKIKFLRRLNRIEEQLNLVRDTRSDTAKMLIENYGRSPEELGPIQKNLQMLFRHFRVDYIKKKVS